MVNTQKHLQRLSQILNYINTNYRQRLTLTDVAKHEHLSVPYLSSFFERYMGRNFLQYYTDLRLERAVNELLSSDESIEEISYNNGFSNPRSFVQAFKKKYSVLLSVYRKQEQQITPAPSHDNQDLINYLELDQRSYLGTLASYIAGEEALAAPVTKPGNFLKVKPVSIEKNEKTLTHYYKNFICVGKAKDLLTAEIQTLLKRAQREIGFKFIKFHGIFSDDMLVVQRDAKGSFQFSFVLIDKVLDFLLSVGLKPLLQFSFMPEVLASDPDTSPAMFGFLNDKDYYRLYQETYLAVKETSTALAFGSPSMIQVVAAGEVWLESFISFARKEKILPDFINLHYYSDLFGDRSSYNSQNAFVTLSKIPLTGIPQETALVKEYYVNRNHGSVFDTWADCGAAELINREDKALLEQMSAPGMYHY